jgi:hypothetical protein
VETPVGTTTNDDDDAAKNATPDKGEPDTDDGGIGA